MDSYVATYSGRSERVWYRPLRLAINVAGNGFLYRWAARTLEEEAGTDSLSLLDAACGDGILRRYLSKRHQHTGIDFSQRILRRALRYHPSTYFRADLTHLPFPRATFDAIVSIQTLQYLLRPDLAFAEIARTLKPRGKVLISVPNYQSFKYRRHGLPQIEVQRFDSERIVLLMSKDFDIKKLETQGFWIPVPRIPIHIPGAYSPDCGLAWTIVACVRK
jgi:SAM-dependent methyltransferase